MRAVVQLGTVRTTVLLCLAFVGMVVAAFVASMVREDLLSSEALHELGVITLPEPRALTPFSLSHVGGTFDNADFEGGWSFVFFGFTNCPDICPTAMSVLGQAKRRLAESDAARAAQFRGVLVSVDPERDLEPVVAKYAQAFAPEFVGLTGERAALAELALQLNVAFAKVPDEESADGYTMDHTGNIVVINPRGHYHGFIKMPHKVDTVLAAFKRFAADYERLEG